MDGLDGPERARVNEGLGERRNRLGVQVLRRSVGELGAAAAVAAEAGRAANQHPRALERRLVGVDLGDACLHGRALLVDVLLGHGLAAGGAARHGERVGLEDDDASALNALGAGGEAGRAEAQRLLGRLEHLAEPGAAVEADRNFADLFEFGIEPELLELPHRPLGRVGVGVGARLASAEPVAGVVVPGHDLVVLGAQLDDPGDDRVGWRLCASAWKPVATPATIKTAISDFENCVFITPPRPCALNRDSCGRQRAQSIAQRDGGDRVSAGVRTSGS